jgi:GNAT superfamily N-acetyltransferase
MMSKQEYTVRRMSPHEVQFAIDLAAEEGWNPGLYDADCFYAADSEGFFVGLVDDRPVSSLSVVRYGEHYGFLGLYIVHPQYRGRRYGLDLFTQGMSYLEGRDVGLDGVLEQEPKYEQWGFRRAFCNVRYEGKARHREPVDRHIVELSQVPFAQVEAFDGDMFRAPRPEFLRRWIRQPESIALGVMENEALAGYIVLRKCRVGYKIGPLFAGNKQLAEALFNAGSSCLERGTTIFLDVPSVNPAAVELAKRHQMSKVFETARMYRMITQEELELPYENWYSVTTFELG